MSSNTLRPTSFTSLSSLLTLALVMMLAVMLPSTAQAQTNNTASLSILSDGDQFESDGVFTVNVTLAAPVASVVTPTTVTLNATAGVTVSGSLTATFGLGEQAKTVTFNANDNGTDNADLEWTVDIASVTGEAANGGSEDSATIFDDDGPGIYFELMDTEIVEDDEGGYFYFSVNTTGNVATFQTINFTLDFSGSTANILDSSAFKGADPADGYLNLEGFAGSIPAGQSSAAYMISIENDQDEEGDEPAVETVELAFSDTDDQAGDASDTASFDIIDDDVFVSLGWLEEEGGDLTEINEGTSATLVAMLSHESPYNIELTLNFTNDDVYTVGPYVVGDPSVANRDYLLDTTELTIDAGDTEAQLPITAFDDSVYELDDNVMINATEIISVDGGSAWEDGMAYFTIYSDDEPPTVAVSGASSVNESDETEDALSDFESPTYSYSLSLSEAAGEDMWAYLDFSGSDANVLVGSAVSKAPGSNVPDLMVMSGDDDFADGDGDAIFVYIGAGNTTASLPVAVNNDQFDEDWTPEVVNATVEWIISGDFDNYYFKAGKTGDDYDSFSQEASTQLTDIVDDDDYVVSLSTLVGTPFLEDPEADLNDRRVVVGVDLLDNPTIDSGIYINVTVALSGTALLNYDYEVTGLETEISYNEITIEVDPGDAGSSFALLIIDDIIWEAYDGNETVNVTLIGVQGGSFAQEAPTKTGGDTIVYEIVDDEEIPTLSLWADDYTIYEGGAEPEKTGNAFTTIYASLSHPSSANVTFDAYVSSNSTASFGVQALKSGGLNPPESGGLDSADIQSEGFLNPGFMLFEGVDTWEVGKGGSGLTNEFFIEAVDDDHDEDVAGCSSDCDEFFTIVVDNVDGAEEGDQEITKAGEDQDLTIYIVDNDDVPTVDIRMAGYRKSEDWIEGDELVLEAALSHLSVNDVYIGMDFDGTADGESNAYYDKKSFGEIDYTYESANVTVSSGNWTDSFSLYTNTDDIDEDVFGQAPGETVNITASYVVNGTTDEDSGYFTVLTDDNDVPSVYFSIVDSNGDEVDELEESEGQSASKSPSSEYRWLAELSHRSVNDIYVTVECAEYDEEGTAVSSCDVSKDGHLGTDYMLDPSGTIYGGGTNVSRDIWVYNDDLDEWDEEALLMANVTNTSAVMDDNDQDGADFYSFNILDDDDPVTFELVQTESLFKDGMVEITEGLEAGTDFANYTVVLSAVSGKSVYFDVDYSDVDAPGLAVGYADECVEPAYAGTSDQAAKSCSQPIDADFLVSNANLWINAGNMTASFTVEGLSDEYNEGTEAGTVSVSVAPEDNKRPDDPSAEPGEVTEAAFDILDDDKAPVAYDDNIYVEEDGYAFIDVLSGHDASEDPAFAGSDPDMDEDYCGAGKFCSTLDLLDLESGPGAGSYTLPEHGTLELYANWTNSTPIKGAMDPQFVYTPDPDFSGIDSFTYLLDDGKGLPSNATVTLYVVGENDKPNSMIDRVETNEDTPIVIDVLANDTDPDLDELTVIAVAQGDDGEVDGIATLVDGVVTFTPALNFNGVARFEYTVSDGSLTDSDPVEVTVVPVNDAPTAVDDEAATPYETATTVEVLANDTDVESDAFSVTEVTTPANGTAVLNDDGTVLYTPNADFAGIDTFVYTVAEDADAEVTSNATVSVTVGDNPNSVPVAGADVAEVESGADVTITVLTNDTDGDEGAVLTVTGVASPAEGEGSTVLNEDGTITYTAPADFVGDAIFTYTVSDGTDSSEGTVTVTVNAVENQAPDAEDDAAAVTAGQSVTIGVLTNDADPEGDPLVISGFTLPPDGEGSVVDNGDGTLTYTAPEAFDGDTSFQYTVADSEGKESSAIVTVNVSPDLDGISTDEEDGVDGDGDGTPDGDGNGDGVEDSEQTNVSSLTVQTDENEAQQGQYITVSVETDGEDPNDDTDDTTDEAASLSEVQSIPNPDPTTFPEGATAPIGFLKFKVQKAEVGVASRVVIRIPEGATVTDYYKYGKTPDNQTDHWYKFSYQVDENGNKTGAQIDNVNRKITLHFVDGLRGDSDLTANGIVDDPGTPVFLTNDAPVAVADAASIEEDGSATIAVLANDTDADDDALTIASVSTPANGTAVANPDGTITYTPNAHFNGEDTFTYNVTDNRGETVQATVTVTISSVDDNPVATADEASTVEDTAVMINIFANDFHPDAIPFFVVQIADPDHGTAVYHNDGTLTYTPDANFAGTETFTYTIGDARGAGSFTVGTVTVVVAGSDDAPVGVADASTTDEDTAVIVSVTANDSDPDGDAITVASVTQPTNGAVVDNGDGTVTYTPAADFAGSDTFTYTLSDGTNTSAAVEVTVTVTPINDAPVFAEGDAIATAADPFFLDTDYAFDYTAATDVDSEELTYTWEISLASTFAEVTYSADISGGSATVAAADLIAALEPLGLTPDSELMVYQRVVANDGELDGASEAQQITFARASNVSNESAEIPTEYFLSGNYPNPFNPSTTIEFGLPEAADVSIVLFDMTGRQVQVLSSGQLAAGVHTVNVQMGDLPSGLYIYRLVAGSKVFTKTMHLIK